MKIKKSKTFIFSFHLISFNFISLHLKYEDSSEDTRSHPAYDLAREVPDVLPSHLKVSIGHADCLTRARRKKPRPRHALRQWEARALSARQSMSVCQETWANCRGPSSLSVAVLGMEGTRHLTSAKHPSVAAAYAHRLTMAPCQLEHFTAVQMPEMEQPGYDHQTLCS